MPERADLEAESRLRGWQEEAEQKIKLATQVRSIKNKDIRIIGKLLVKILNKLEQLER